MEQTYNIELLAELLDEMGAKGSGKITRLIGKKLHGKLFTDFIEILQGYEEVFVHFARGIRQHGQLQKSDYINLSKISKEIQDKIRDVTSVDLPIRQIDSQERNYLYALRLLGGLEVDLENGFAALFLSPRMFTQSFSIASLLESRSRVKHIMAIASIRGEQINPDEAKELEKRYVAPFALKLRSVLQRITMNYIPSSWCASILQGLSVELLPTATDFYEAGVDYYGTQVGRKRHHYIFATTSGILLPQEYYGSAYWERILKVPELAAKSDKNPKRETYFNALANVRKRPRWYFFEISRASKAFQATIGDLQQIVGNRAVEQYKADAQKIIAKFLQLPHFGLIPVSEFPSQYDHLTLGNGRHLFLSSRDKKQKNKIGHGLWLRPSLRGFGPYLEKLQETKFVEWLGALGVAATMSTVEEDPRMRLLEALISGFAVPFILATARYWSRRQAEDTFLDLASDVSRSISVVTIDHELYWHPEHKSINEKMALKKAEKIISTLERF